MTSALAAKIEGIHELPEGVLLAHRDKRGAWGEVNAYYAYCHRCCQWLDFAAARAHTDCTGWHWDYWLAKAAEKWWPEIEKISERVRSGQHPYYDGIHDRRDCAPIDGSDFPALVVGQRQLLRTPPSVGPCIQLDVLVDIPLFDSEGSCGNSVDACATADTALGNPLKVLMYFHGHGGEDCQQAPNSLPGCAVIAVQCPSLSRDGFRFFWFTEGPGGAWDRHEHEKLRRSSVMLQSVSSLVDAILAGLAKLDFKHGVQREISLVGVSMGACAVLEFARAFPNRVSGAAIISGYYDEAQMDDLVQATLHIPFLLVHSRGDRACPFATIEKLHLARVAAAEQHGLGARRVRPRPCGKGDSSGSPSQTRPNGGDQVDDDGPDDIVCGQTEAWFCDGQQHTPTAGELMAAIQWLFQHA